MTEERITPDIDSTNTNDWGIRQFPIQACGARNLVQIVIDRSVLDAIHEHGLTRTDVEICGVLVGNGYRDERGPYLFVDGMIRGEGSENQAAQVTFTSETWNHIHNELDQHFDGKRILGWYHTHPGFGIFLSGMDMFIQENFFNDNEQLAYVYDPIGGDDGLFVWHEGKAEKHRYLVKESDGSAMTTTKPKMTAAGTRENSETHLSPTASPTEQVTKLERRCDWLENFLLATLLLALVWPPIVNYFDLGRFSPVSQANEPEQVNELPNEFSHAANPPETKSPQMQDPSVHPGQWQSPLKMGDAKKPDIVPLSGRRDVSTEQRHNSDRPILNEPAANPADGYAANPLSDTNLDGSVSPENQTVDTTQRDNRPQENEQGEHVSNSAAPPANHPPAPPGKP